MSDIRAPHSTPTPPFTPTPRTGQSSGKSVWQPRQPVFWALLVGVAFGIFALCVTTITQAKSPGIALATIVACLAQCLLLWWLAQLIPRVRLIPQPVQLVSVLAGGGFALLIAAQLNSMLDAPLSSFGLSNLSGSLSAPFVEDATRMVCVILVLGLISARHLRLGHRVPGGYRF